MIHPRSIKAKLQSWVIIIFVLTGTAGWAGIWGLLYISRTTRSLATEQLRTAEDGSALDGDLAAARRIDREYWLAAATADAAGVQAQGPKLAASWTAVGDHLAKLRAAGERGAAFEAIGTAHAAVLDAWRSVEADAGKPFAEVRAGAYAHYQKRVEDLEAQVSRTTAAAFASVKSQSETVYDWIWVLQIALFVTVAVCQGFSAWAGWKLARTLTGELNALKESAERISMGDLKSEVKVGTADTEIVAVSEALDRLRVSLGKAMDRLAARRRPAAEPAAEAKPADADEPKVDA